MLDLATRLSGLRDVRGVAPWPDHEYVKGWGVFGLPFESGHVLALRVFPENDFGAYRTIWHRDPGGRWSIYVDGPRLDTACPRYYGPACDFTGHADITLEWTGANSLHVTMHEPAFDWTLVAATTPLMTLLNKVNAAMPLSSWRSPSLLRVRESAGRALGMGRLSLRGVMPSGHIGVLMPQEMYLIAQSHATLDGIDFGRPTRVRENPRIGELPLPARGVLAIGQAMWKIADHAEYERTREETAP